MKPNDRHDTGHWTHCVRVTSVLAQIQHIFTRMWYSNGNFRFFSVIRQPTAVTSLIYTHQLHINSHSDRITSPSADPIHFQVIHDHLTPFCCVQNVRLLMSKARASASMSPICAAYFTRIKFYLILRRCCCFCCCCCYYYYYCWPPAIRCCCCCRFSQLQKPNKQRNSVEFM